MSEGKEELQLCHADVLSLDTHIKVVIKASDCVSLSSDAWLFLLLLISCCLMFC